VPEPEPSSCEPRPFSTLSIAPASLKNALDHLHREWADKPAGVVSYGGVSAGLRAATALRPGKKS